MSNLVVNPEADLAQRRGDERLPGEILQKLQLFQALKKTPSFEKFPNSVVLRHFQPGEVICQQGDAGASAFYILTAEDLLAVRQAQVAASDETVGPKQREAVERLAANVQALAGTAPNDPRRQRATAHLLIAEGKAKAKSGWGSWFGSSQATRKTSKKSPTSIAIDGPSAVDMSTRQAPLYEGEVFGEMSCMTMAPRSATVVAAGDCYLLEFLRNIFDQIQRDVGYQQRLDAIYRDRVLTNQLNRLELFADVSDEELAPLREGAQLQRIEPGQIIFDQGDASDAVYLVRSGMVQVVVDRYLALRADDVLDWSLLAQTLLQGDETTPKASVAAPTTPTVAASDAPKSGKPSAAEMLAAARAKKAAATYPSSATPVASEPAAAETTLDETPKPAKPTAAEMLAAARVKKSAVDPSPVLDPIVEEKPKPKSVAEMMAAAKASKPAAAPATSSPLAHLWQAFSSETRAAIRNLVADTATASEQDKSLILVALNARMRDRDWLTAKAISAQLEHASIAAHTRSFPDGIKGLAKKWTDLEVRVAGRVILELLLPRTLVPRPAHNGPPRVLSYLSRGEVFGEMGVLLEQPRTATCLAYDHPPDASRSSVPVDLVKIPAETFKALVERSPVIQRRVDAILRERKAKDERRAAQPRYEAGNTLAESPDFQELGLIQGQKLLLVDLDKCTRCGDCVRACISTHEDGRSRLYLDGPRFDRYLVPSACRNCLNPACMIGCPVGSIQRGDDGQIEIRDWCIGCGMCAEQCPYDSIQMHDLGLVPNKSVGWRVVPASATGGNSWTQPSFRDSNWPLCSAPIDWNIELQSLLAMRGEEQSTTLATPVCFRLSFEVDYKDVLPGITQEFSLVTQGASAEIWLNGQPLMLQSEEKRHRDKTKKNKGRWYEGPIPSGMLRRGQNTLAIKIDGPVAAGEGVLDIEIVPGGGELAIAGGTAKVKEVTLQAVVCDLCSSLPTGPACVTMCPHDAAIRVDARTAFSGA